MLRSLRSMCVVVLCACGGASTPDGGAGGGGGGGGLATGGGGGSSTTGGGGGSSTGGGGGSSFLTDGGSRILLTGSTAFTPIGSVVQYAINGEDGGRRQEALTIVFYDGDAGVSCNLTSPGSDPFHVSRIELYNVDGGPVTTGTYRIVTQSDPLEGLVSTVNNLEVTGSGPSGYGGIATSGTTTITLLSATRIAGSFQSTLSQFDGGASAYGGEWDIPLSCP